MSAITDWITAVGTGVTGIVASVAAIPAFKAVKESRQLRADQARPYVAVTLEPSEASRHFLYLVVRNHGQTIAREVRFKFDKELRSTIDSTGFPIAKVKFLHDGIAAFAPHAEYRVLFDSIPDRHAAKSRGDDLADSYTVTVQYKTAEGKVLPAEEYVLDSALLRSAPYVREFNIHDLVKQVAQLSETLKTWADRED